jgi:hypothetical protein
MADYRAIRKNDADFKAKMKAKEEMQAKGEVHDWIKIPYGHGQVLVCKKIGYCPAINGFLRMSYVNEWVRRKKLDEEYNAFKKIRVEILAEDYEMYTEHMDELIEKIFLIKQDFHVEKMKESVSEMKKVIGDKNDGEKV